MSQKKGGKDRQEVFSMTVALGILSRAAAPHRYTLLHVCLVPPVFAGVSIGGFLFNSAQRVLSALLGSGPGVFLY